MAVLGRLLFSSAERLDLADLLSVDSYSAGDFKYFLKGLVGSTKPYILKGFDVIDPQNAIGQQNCSIRIADSIVFYPGSAAGPYFAGLPEGNPNSVPLVPELRKNAVNYVYLTFTTFNTSTDTRAFWDPDKDGGTGGEFTQDVNTESVLGCQVNVSVGSFPANTIPIAKITVGAVVITAIEDARDLMFRLGTGGVNPNPNASYNWRSLPDASYTRTEPPTMMTAGGVNPFEGADKNIETLKEWMDAVMSKLKELGGTVHWYDDVSTFNVVNSFMDAFATTIQSKGLWVHSTVTPGFITWTEDINVRLTADLRSYIIRAGSVQLQDGQVAYLSLDRSQPINNTDSPVAFTNAQSYINTVNGSVGLFANLQVGDYIRNINDPNQDFVRVEQFWTNINASGPATTAALAKSISISAPYVGPTVNSRAVYDRGVYTSSDVIVSDRNQAVIATAGGNFFWLAFRSDVIENIGNIATTDLTIAVNNNDGNKALVTSSGAHGLLDNQRVTITGTTNYNDTYQVEVASTTTFYIPVTAFFAGSQAGAAHYAIVTTAATFSPGNPSFQLESANNGFPTDAAVNVDGTTNYDGTYRIAVIDPTHFQIPMPGPAATETAGTVTIATLILRTQTGPFTLFQGQSVAVNGILSSQSMLPAFIGMTLDYAIPPGYNTLNGTENFNTSSTDSLVVRLSELTGMMADKAQDKTIKYLTEALTAINTPSGPAQLLTFAPAGNSLTILQPGSPGNAVVALPSVGGISLLVNQSAYIIIDRNIATTPSIVVADNSAVPVGENVIVIASRLSDGTVYLWNGEAIVGSAPIGPSSGGLIKIDLYDPLSTTLPTGNPVTIDNVSVVAGNLVLFSNLSSGSNEIYMAVGTGTNITSWTAQPIFNGLVTPTVADLVIVRLGDAFANQIGEFNGTTWYFNNTVRYFNGADYWEQSSLITSTLSDNTTNGTVFSVNYVGSENMVVDYSIIRGTFKETASLHITTDGINVSVVSGGTNLNGPDGVSFDGIISGSNVVLRYTTTSTGSSATMKYSVKRWSDFSGGPGGLPSYSGFTPSAGAAAGSNGDIQFNSGGLLAGNSNFEIDVANGSINLNGLNQTILSSGLTILDNTVSPTTIFTYDATSWRFAIIEYSILRNGIYRVGRLPVTNDGIIAAYSDDFIETAPTEVVLSASIVGANVAVMYTSTSTGFNGTLKYSMRRWS